MSEDFQNQIKYHVNSIFIRKIKCTYDYTTFNTVEVNSYIISNNNNLLPNVGRHTVFSVVIY